MIGFFPNIYPDELFYSWIARYYQRSGYSAYRYAIADVFTGPNVKPSIEFVSRLNDDAKEVITGMLSMEQIIRFHTMYPAYSAFLPLDRRIKSYETVRDTRSDVDDVLMIPNSACPRFVRYCPMCVKEDREKYGETYMHCEHQVRGIDICFRHRCYLVNTGIPIKGNSAPRLYVMENEIDMETDEHSVPDERQIQLAEYVLQVLRSAQVPLTEQASRSELGLFFHHQIAGTCYSTARGASCHIKQLADDYNVFHPDDTKEPWYLQKVLEGKKTSLIDVCRLALFLGISAQELIEMKVPDKSPEEEFDARVRSFRKRGLSYPAIAKVMGVSLTTVSLIGRKKKVRRQHAPNRKGGPKTRDWERMDAEMFPKVKQAVRDIFFGADGRPHRVNLTAVRKAVGLKEGQLQMMPKCLAEVIRYHENQQHYWAREVIWAIDTIRQEDGILNWKHVRDLTNIRKTDLLSCMDELKDISSVHYKTVQEVI